MYEFEKSDSKLQKNKDKDVALLIGPEGGFKNLKIEI